jgi:hypothetical protein
MKKDILGREIHANDIVVVKGNYGCDMEIGVFIGKSVRTMHGPKHAEDMFLVENPGQKELDIKKDVLDKLAKEKVTAAAEKAKKNAQKADIHGTIYLMSRDSELFLYCGKCMINTYIDGKFKAQTDGYLYLSGGRWFRGSAADVHFMGFDRFKRKTEERMYVSEWPTQKSIKKYEKVYNKIEVPAVFTLENSWTSTDCHGVTTKHLIRQEISVLYN